MSEVKINIIYKCKRCGSKGKLVDNVESFNFSSLKNLPCGCLGNNGKFHILHPL
jgi:hypothetical protein